jgi:hypothetical protein
MTDVGETRPIILNKVNIQVVSVLPTASADYTDVGYLSGKIQFRWFLSSADSVDVVQTRIFYFYYGLREINKFWLMKEEAYGTIVVNLHPVSIVGETMYRILHSFPCPKKCHLCDAFVFLIINI